MSMLRFLVDKHDLARIELAAGDTPALSDGQALLAVERFGFSSNNLTYAALGDALAYWRFFAQPEPWGCIPVWGFAEVIASRGDGASVGERLFGYLPMATHLVVTPVREGAGLRDDSPHRRPLPFIYNAYTRVPRREPAVEAAEMLLRPLFFAAFLIDDFLVDNGFFGADSVIIASASSKTALGLAHLISRRGTHEVIGLTAAANRAFVAGLGSYDRLVTYGELDALDVAGKAVLIDVAGAPAVRGAVHARLGERLVFSSIVGNTHLGAAAAGAPLAGPTPVPFAAPPQLERLNRRLGAQAVQKQVAQAWSELLVPVAKWLRVTTSCGPAAVTQTYLSLLANRGRPDEGHVMSLVE
jgi:hypothetical protein